MTTHLLYKIRLITNKLALDNKLVAVIKNSGWLLFDKLTRLFLGLLVGAWVARYLGPEQYGQLAYVLAYLAFFQAVVLLGMDGIIVRELAKDKEKASEILGTAFTLRLIVGIVCWILAVGIIVGTYGWQDDSVYITLLAGSVLVFQAADTIDLWFQSQSQSKRTVISKLIAYAISNGLKVVLILNKAPLLAFAAVMAVETLIAAISLIYAYRKYPCKGIWFPKKNRALLLLQESWPFIISGLSIIIYMRIDQIFIKEFLGEKDLGIYAAVLPLAMLWTFIPTTLSTSLAPYIARKKTESESGYWLTLSKLFRLYAFIGWLICIPVFIFSDFIVSSLYGADYLAGSNVLKIVVFSNIFINMGLAQSLWILNEGLSKISLYKTLIGACVCLVSNIILIPIYGIYGAAFSAVLAQFFSAVFSNLFFSRELLVMQLKSLLLIR